ncbi:MAG: chromosomal replication initiator protein DnaA [Oscillatoriales cyanobacterium SM2_2_1]|nr:chromosomal replication initiator protein DnaA [Oscillatoriales cyanobacterium SM2_2_1]
MAVDISLETLWEQVLVLLSRQLSRPTFEGWIKSVVAEELTTEALVIRTPHPFAKSWLQKYYYTHIKAAVTEILGYAIEIEIISEQKQDLEHLVGNQNANQDINVPVTRELSANSLPLKSEGAEGGEHRPLNPKYIFSRFVVGATNRMAHAAALAVAESPGREFNPLFLCGGVGLGKTHLMQAIAHYRLEIESQTRVAYFSTEQFTNDLIAAIRKDGTQAFRERYRQIDMLLVDDVQFIEGKEYTQEEFFHTFNTLYESGKQIVLASDRPPGKIQGLQDRLCSRFSMGLIADIQVPDLETRMAILQKKAEYENLRIPGDVIHHIAASYTSNIRELEGGLVRAVAYISISGLPMTVENVAPMLNPPKEPLEVSADLVLRVVCEDMGIAREDLLSNSRRREISHARKVAMYLMRQHTELSLPKIGEALGGKDHTSVLYSCQKIAEQQSADSEVAQLLRQLSDRIYVLAQTRSSS